MENLKNVAPIEDFNWDAYENGETVTNVSHDELEKAYDGTLNKVNDREVVDGTVIAMNKREVVVNIGYKSDGIIPLNEFRGVLASLAYLAFQLAARLSLYIPGRQP